MNRHLWGLSASESLLMREGTPGMDSLRFDFDEGEPESFSWDQIPDREILGLDDLPPEPPDGESNVEIGTPPREEPAPGAITPPADPAAPAAIGATGVSQPNAVPPAEAVPPTDTPPAEVPAFAPLARPEEFAGYPVLPGGATLYDPRFEDPDSDDALGLMHGTEDQDGVSLTDGIGEGAYAIQRQEYFRQKALYEQEEDSRVYHENRTLGGVIANNMQGARASFVAEVSKYGVTEEQVTGTVETLEKEAIGVMEEWRASQEQQYISRGYSRARAEAFAARDILKIPGGYTRAFEIAKGRNFDAALAQIAAQIKPGTQPAKPATTARAATPPALSPAATPGGNAPSNFEPAGTTTDARARRTINEPAAVSDIRAEAARLAKGFNMTAEDLLDPRWDQPQEHGKGKAK